MRRKTTTTTTTTTTAMSSRLQWNHLSDDLMHSICQDLQLIPNNEDDENKNDEKEQDLRETCRDALESYVRLEPTATTTKQSTSRNEQDEQIDEPQDLQTQMAVARTLLRRLGFPPQVYSRLKVPYDNKGSAGSFPDDHHLESPCDGIPDFIIPALSPVPWMSETVWRTMSQVERTEFLRYMMRIDEVDVDNLPERPTLQAKEEEHERLLSTYACRFGAKQKNGIDRILLGHGPRKVLILVGIHGNEPCGVHAVKRMLARGLGLFRGQKADDLENDQQWTSHSKHHLFYDLTMEFILGNPHAYQQNVRFVQKNLNRLFHDSVIGSYDGYNGHTARAPTEADNKQEEDDYHYELQRARLIHEAIRHSDVVLDVHSCSANVGSFALPCSMSVAEELARQLPVQYVVESLAHMTLEGGTTLDAALQFGIPAVCVECGQHNHPDIVARAAAIISTFLRLQLTSHNEDDIVSPSLTSPQREPPTAMKCVVAERVHEGFEWIRQFPEFHLVPYQTPVFRDSVLGVAKCPFEEGAHIVMPTEHPVLGEEALFWAIPSPDNK